MFLSNPDFSSLIIPSRKCVIKPVFCPAAVLKDPARLILHIRRIFPGSQAPAVDESVLPVPAYSHGTPPCPQFS